MELIQSVLWDSADEANQLNGVPNFEELINPPNEKVEARVKKLMEEFGLDPVEMREVHKKYGRVKKSDEWVDVMDWRFPEVQSLYWSYLGLKRCAHNPSRETELRRLEKKIYVSMMYLFYRGRMGLPSGRQITPQQFVSDRFFVEPNIELAPATHQAYLDMIEKAQASRLDHHTEGTVEIGHLHFIERNITWLYFLNREVEALEWLRLATEMYPKQMSWKRFYNNTENVVNLDELVMAELEDDIQRGGDYQVQAILLGMLKKYYTNLALGNEVRAAEYGDFIAEFTKDINHDLFNRKNAWVCRLWKSCGLIGYGLFTGRRYSNDFEVKNCNGSW